MLNRYREGEVVQVGDKAGEVVRCIETERNLHVTIAWNDGRITGFIIRKRREE